MRKSLQIGSLFGLAGFFICSFLLSSPLNVHAQHPDWFASRVTQEIDFRQNITTPTSFLGFIPGEWHVRHDQLVQYLQLLARESDRIQIEEYGRTWQGRSLIYLTISSPDNLKKIKKIRREHLKLADPEKSVSLNLEEMPVVTWLGYSIHGNEPSGVNAALLVAYYLAAGESEEINNLLKNSVILLDPAYNPDGVDRFASWVNNNRSFTPSSDPKHREHHEPWPGSRTNHYWFDLNRDWMPVQHPESRGRIRLFQSWKPNVLTDHHEMGPNTTYFFQPGVPSRNNPLSPDKNYEITEKLAHYHAAYLDKVYQLYWTREVFDDFYVGKGSTYPDLQGTIGILFEQASSRGHFQETVYGKIDFSTTIRNQFLTTLSTLYGSLDLRLELLEYMRTFYQTAIRDAENDPVKGWIFGDPSDHARNYHLLDLLLHHDISIYELEESYDSSNFKFNAENSWLIPASQPQYRFIKSLFEKRTEFADSVFYDVSTWNLFLSFDMPYVELRKGELKPGMMGKKICSAVFTPGKTVGFNGSSATSAETSGSEALMDENIRVRRHFKSERNFDDPYAYVFEWNGFYAPRAAYRLMDAGVRLMVASRRFGSNTSSGMKVFDYGTILVSPGLQEGRFSRAELENLLNKIALEDGLDVYALTSGLSSEGVDLGSRTFEPLVKPRIMVLTGEGVDMREAGEIWHLLDQRYRMPVSMVDKRNLSGETLARYNTLVMVQGSYQDIPEIFEEELRRWISSGNTLIVKKNAINWLQQKDWVNVELKEVKNPLLAGEQGLRYVDLPFKRGAQAVGGVILQAVLDPSHPLAYGYQREKLPVFRNSRLFFEEPENRYAVALRYEASPLISGFLSQENLMLAQASPVIITSRLGSGRVIMSTDNLNFRAFWFGTNRLFANSIFFGHTIQADATIR